MSNKFVKVHHAWFESIGTTIKGDNEKDNDTPMKKVGTDCFVLWFYLKKRQEANDTAPVQINAIVRDIGCRGFQKPASVRKLLLKLKQYGFIECDYLTPKTKPTELLYIKVKEFYKELDEKAGWSKIGYQLFDDYISKMGHISFAIYCLLYKLHNVTFGGEGCSGFANPSEDTIASIIGLRCRQTVANNIKNISSRLLKVMPQDPVVIVNDFGIDETKYFPHHYEVKAKIPGTKYNISDQKEQRGA